MASEGDRIAQAERHVREIAAGIVELKARLAQFAEDRRHSVLVAETRAALHAYEEAHQHALQQLAKERGAHGFN